MILLNENRTQPCTVIINGLSFEMSDWQLNHINLKMKNCNAAELTLKIKYVTNVTIENSTFGNWVFNQVQHVFLKNCTAIKNFQHHFSLTTPQVLWKI